MHTTEAQDQPEAPDTLYHVPAPGPGTEVPPKTVPVHSGESGILGFTQPHRDPSQNLVPKQEGQSQASPRGRARETENGEQTHASARHWSDFSRRSSVVWTICSAPRLPSFIPYPI